jgi:hypothetical protein
MTRSGSAVNTTASRIAPDCVTAIYTLEKSIVDAENRPARMRSPSLASHASIVTTCAERIDAFSNDCCTQ